jgi:alpha-1,3-mannosyltransferase
MSYTQKAFEFTRVFLYKWTVNWHFLPESWFVSQQLAVLLLLAHLMLLWSFANRRWFAEQGLWEAGQSFLCRSPRDVKSSSAKKGINQPRSSLPAEEVLRMVFTANFVGIVCARSLHYQFYSW